MLRAFEAISRENPFQPGRIEAEKAALGPAFSRHGDVWHVDAARDGANPNVPRLVERAEELAADLRRRLRSGARATKAELAAYRELVHYVLFERCEDAFFEMIGRDVDPEAPPGAVGVWDSYRKGFADFLELPGVSLHVEYDAAHVFALAYQTRRAFHHIYRGIQGGSMPAARLRATVWQSIFTHDAQRYRRHLYARMADVPTLIVGESGTGKELVARAIGWSRFLPFDAKRKRFAATAASLFRPVNVSALPTALIESELFGHRRGAFTGAIADRTGRLEECSEPGTTFLDEIGELEPEVQVKLLRVLQERTFQRVGETNERRFSGKIVAATNRDLPTEMAAGRFRPDLYYRLCADVVHTPRLADQIADAPSELRNLVLVLCQRIVGVNEADELCGEVTTWIGGNLPVGYAWPGNVRELEQCVRNVLVRGTYDPPANPAPAERFAAALGEVSLTAEDVLREYCTRAYHRLGSYEEAARRLAIDRRTVKAHLNQELLDRLRSGER